MIVFARVPFTSISKLELIEQANRWGMDQPDVLGLAAAFSSQIGDYRCESNGLPLV